MSQAERAALIESAIKIVGKQSDLARILGCGQQRISKLLHGEVPLTAEDALAIHLATAGKISASKLRPDIWPTTRIAKQAAQLVSA